MDRPTIEITSLPSASPTYDGRPLARPDDDVVDQGLRFDIETLIDRRRALQLVGYVGLSASVVALAACAPSTIASPASSAGATTAAVTGAACAAPIPEETAGPFPADGTNGPDVLTESGVVREDIRSSFGELSGTAEGIPLTIKLAIQNAAKGCSPYAGAAVYLWHCDREGRYSLYSQGATDQNYLRGVQAAGDDGVVTFQSVFPACYRGRWPHIHFEVYPDLATATDDANVVATSQVALPEDACHTVYATPGYEQSVQNLQQVSLATDGVFRDDGGVRQLGTVGGSVESGYTVELAVPVGG
jgi:protocatechuate 3,4-dioxygenase beta subunit